MSPAGVGVQEDSSFPRSVFMQRLVREVPSLQDALMFYNTTMKEHQYVGTALQMTEAWVNVVASTALPLANPLLSHIGGWGTLDQWACQGLDHVEEAAPIVTQSTEEVVNRTRSLMLRTLSGVGESTQHTNSILSTLSGALATHAMNTVRVVAGTQAGLTLAEVAYHLLNTTNAIVDTCLPLEKCDHVILDHDGRRGDFGLRVKVLTDKCHRRVKAKLCDVLQVNHCQPLDPDDLDITIGHLIELSRRLMVDWHTKMSQQMHASRLFKCAKMSGTMFLNYINNMQSAVLAKAGTVWALVTNRAGRVLGIVLSGPAGPLLVAGMVVVNKVGKKGMEISGDNVYVVTAMLRGSIVMVKGSALVADGVVRDTVKDVKDWGVGAVERVVRRGGLVPSQGIWATKRAVTGATQGSVTRVAVVSSTVQNAVICMVGIGGSVGRQGVYVMRSLWCANANIILRVFTLSHQYLPESKHLPYFSSLLQVPNVSIPGRTYHGREQQLPEAAAAIDTITAPAKYISNLKATKECTKM